MIGPPSAKMSLPEGPLEPRLMFHSQAPANRPSCSNPLAPFNSILPVEARLTGTASVPASAEPATDQPFAEAVVVLEPNVGELAEAKPAATPGGHRRRNQGGGQGRLCSAGMTRLDVSIKTRRRDQDILYSKALRSRDIWAPKKRPAERRRAESRRDQWLTEAQHEGRRLSLARVQPSDIVRRVNVQLEF